MSIRKRSWTNAKGEQSTTWVVDYADTKGARRLKSFKLKKEAEAFASRAATEVRDGTHVADSASATIKEAGELWIKSAGRRVERGTLVQYQQHLKHHIEPFLGATLLSHGAGGARLRRQDDRRRTVAVDDAQGAGVLGLATSGRAGARPRGSKSREGEEPEPPEGRRQALGEAAEGQAESRRGYPDAGRGQGHRQRPGRPLAAIAADCDLHRTPRFRIAWSSLAGCRPRTERASRPPARRSLQRHRQTEVGSRRRTVPMPPLVMNALREWRLACPRPRTGEKDADGMPIVEEIRPEQFVFPNGQGKVESLSNIMQRGYLPTQIAAGVAVPTAKKDREGRPIMRAKYTGLHALRHFYASWLINRKEDGGLGLPPKTVQERLGHSTIALTMDTYSHLFPRTDDASELAAAEAVLLR